MSYGLSKSKLMSFRQCPKRLWLDVHRPGLAVIDPQTEAAFATGREVGEVARRLYDDGTGITIEYDPAMSAALSRTRDLLRRPATNPIFEATFQRNGLLIRADVLLRGRDGPRLIEVKASTKVKPEHLDDCAIQSWVFERSPVKPRSVSLAHVDNQFVYQNEGEYSELLVEQDLTAEIRPLVNAVEGTLEDAKRVLESKEPESPIGSRCTKPYACPYRGYCWRETEYPLTGLPAIGSRLDELLGQGHYDVRDVPVSALRSVDQRRVWRAVRSGRAELQPGARRSLAALPYPRYFLDFETIGFAVPRWIGTRPYQQIPFQWSLHIERRDGSLDHREFLDLSGSLPAGAVARALLTAAQPEGPIFMYTGFERTCLNTLMKFCPSLRRGLSALAKRLVDLHPVTKQHYYHPGMHGSWSIKAVLPTIAPELDYATLGDIQEGTSAQQAYVEAISPGTSAARREEIRRNLLEYCKHDTLAMVTLARFLESGEVARE